MRTHGVENTIQVDSWVMPGFNFRFTDILASIGIVQMGLLDKRIERIREIQQLYSAGLQNFQRIKLIPNSQNTIGPYIEVLSPERKKIMDELREHRIESRAFYPDVLSVDYFKSPINRQTKSIFSEQGLYLPSGPTLSNLEVEKVLNVIWKFNSNEIIRL